MLLIGINDKGQKEFYSKIDNGKISHVKRIAFGSRKSFQEDEFDDFIEALQEKLDELKKNGISVTDLTDVALFMAVSNASKSGLYLTKE